MTFEQFKTASGFDSLSEVEKVCHLAFFYLKTKNAEEFSTGEAARWLVQAGGASPNRTRLEDRLRSSRDTVRRNKGFALHPAYITDMEQRYNALGQKSQEIVEEGSILPEVAYEKTRGYIEKIAQQINASYEHNLFDGCAVLMRRLVEILLILAYRNLSIENAIKDPHGNYFMLEGIINDAKTNATLNLSRNSKGSVETFRQLGNFSAHKIEYTCHREYIKPEIQNFRALIAELLYKAGLRT